MQTIVEWVFLVKAFDLGNEKCSTVISFVLRLSLIPIVGMDWIIVDLSQYNIRKSDAG